MNKKGFFIVCLYFLSVYIQHFVFNNIHMDIVIVIVTIPVATFFLFYYSCVVFWFSRSPYIRSLYDKEIKLEKRTTTLMHRVFYACERRIKFLLIYISYCFLLIVLEKIFKTHTWATCVIFPMIIHLITNTHYIINMVLQISKQDAKPPSTRIQTRKKYD